jgi:hypothetical protein
MLGSVLQLLGVDLERKITELKGHFHAAVDDATARLRQGVSEGLRETGIALIFALCGAVAATATAGFALAALFIWVDRDNGPLVALAVVGCASAVLAGLMFTLAAARGRRRPVVTPAFRPPVAAPPPVAASPMPRAEAARPTGLSSMMPPPPSSASLLDILTHRVAHRAAAASDEAIDTATELVRGGSRGALLATLTVAGLVGVIIGRRTKHS